MIDGFTIRLKNAKTQIDSVCHFGGQCFVCTAALGTQFFGLLNSFSQADRAVATLLLFVAIGIGLSTSSYGDGVSRLRDLAIAATAVGLSVFSLIFALGGGTLASMIAIWFACFALFRVLQPTELWTRPAALASIIAMLLWISQDAAGISWIKSVAASASAWLSSCFLDIATVAHVRETTGILTTTGTLDLMKSVESAFGVLPLIAVVAVIAVSGRKSLSQALLMFIFAILAWNCVHGVAGWLTVPSTGAETTAETAAAVSSISVLWSLLATILAAMIAIMTAALTEMIPIERSDWDYPVATYFWNFFSRFPASLTSEPEGRS